MADVFISYARQSQPVAKRLADRLTAAGFEVWWDEQIPAHRAYADVIEERLREARCVIVLWSQDAVRSQWVRAEADIARAHGKLIQAVVDGCTPPLPFDQLQRTNLKGWTGALDHPGWRKIEQSVGDLARAPGQAPSPVAHRQIALPHHAGRSRRLLLIGLSGLVGLALLAGGGWWLAERERAASTGSARVSVRPLTADPANAAAAAAIQDQIVSVLSSHGMAPSVLPAGSSDNPGDLVVEGGLQTTEGVTRVTTRVVGGTDRRALWSGTFERPAAEAAALADQVALQVEDVVRCGMLTLPRGRHMDSTTRSLYMNSCATRRQGGKTDQTLEAVRRVAQQDPGFGPALADVALSGAIAAPQMPPDQIPAVRAEADAAADRAIKIDPGLSEAYLAKYLLVAPQGNWLERERWLKKAVSQPGAMSAFNYEAAFLSEVGRKVEALTLARHATSLDPWPGKISVLSELLIDAGEMTEARTLVTSAQRAFPTNPATVRMALDLVIFSDPAAGLARLENVATRPGAFKDEGVTAWRAFVKAQQAPSSAAKTEAARELAEAISAHAIPPDSALRALVVLGHTGEVEAFYRAEKARGLYGDTKALFSPQAAAMRRDPKFMALARDLGLTSYWRASGKWPDFCSGPGLPYKCEDFAR